MADLATRRSGIVFFIAAIATIVGGLLTAPPLACAGVVPLFVAVAMPAFFLTTTSYTLSDERLIVRSMLFTWRIGLPEIRSVTPTNNPISSPALSFDRLRIEYGNGRSVMISPDDKEGFLRDLRSRSSLGS